MGVGEMALTRAKIWNFWFYMGVIYEHTLNRHPHKWSTYFYTLPVVTNQLHWCLLNLLTPNYQLFFYRKNVLQHKIAANIVSWQLWTSVVQTFFHKILQVKSISTISFTVKLQKSLELNIARFLTLNSFKSKKNWLKIALPHKLL